MIRLHIILYDINKINEVYYQKSYGIEKCHGHVMVTLSSSFSNTRVTKTH